MGFNKIQKWVSLVAGTIIIYASFNTAEYLEGLLAFVVGIIFIILSLQGGLKGLFKK